MKEGSIFCFSILLWGVVTNEERETENVQKKGNFLKVKNKKKKPAKWTKLDALQEMTNEEISQVDMPMLDSCTQEKDDNFKVLIAEDTYVHMALLGYILT